MAPSALGSENKHKGWTVFIKDGEMVLHFCNTHCVWYEFCAYDKMEITNALMQGRYMFLQELKCNNKIVGYNH